MGLIALFTHMHIFWMAALLLAMVQFPDFGGFMTRVAGSAEKIAGTKPGEGAIEPPSRPPPELADGGPGIARDETARRCRIEAGASAGAANVQRP